MRTLTITLATVPLLSVAAQLPFWILRASLGWQFLAEGQTPVTGFSLRDIFLATFVCAIAMGAPQFAINRLADDTVKQRAEIYRAYQMNQTDGTVENPTSDPTAGAEEFLREQRRFISSRYWSSIMGISMTIFVINCFTIPVLLFTFRSKEPEAGCLYISLYAGGIFCALLVFLAAVSIIFGGGLPPMIAEPIFYFGSAFGTAFVALAGPLLVFRNSDLKLTSPKLFEKDLTA